MLSGSGPLGTELAAKHVNPASGQTVRGGIFVLVSQTPAGSGGQAGSTGAAGSGLFLSRFSEHPPRGGADLILEVPDRLEQGSVWRITGRAGVLKLFQLPQSVGGLASPFGSNAQSILDETMQAMPMLRRALGPEEVSVFFEKLARVFAETGTAFSRLPVLAILNFLAGSGILEPPPQQRPRSGQGAAALNSTSVLRLLFGLRHNVLTSVDVTTIRKFIALFGAVNSRHSGSGFDGDFETAGDEEELLALVNVLARKSGIGSRYWQTASLSSGGRRVAIVRVLLSRDDGRPSRISLEYPDAGAWRIFEWDEPSRGTLFLADAHPALDSAVLADIQAALGKFGFGRVWPVPVGAYRGVGIDG